jgi:hypothetical protein
LWIKIIHKTQQSKSTSKLTQQSKKCVTFKFSSPLIRRVTILFKHTNVCIAFRATNILYTNLNKKESQNEKRSSDIYRLKCKTWNYLYIGQTGGFIRGRYWERIRHIKTNKPNSAYALHILNNRHENGNMEDTMELLKNCTNGLKMNYRESFFVETYQ